MKDRVTCSGKKIIVYRCICDCGNEVLVDARHLRDGSTKSCGCFKSEKQRETGRKSGKSTFTHRMTGTRIYRIWGNLVSRCCDCNNPAFNNYGGRGITVCDEWKNSFEEFYRWALESGYTDDMTIDRIDNDSGYCPENCRWSTKIEQANNTRNNIFYMYKGELLTLAEISRICGVPYKTLHRRIRSLGWDLQRATTEPIEEHNRK